jgi:hypothetical protein
MNTAENGMDTFYSIIFNHFNVKWYPAHPNWPNIDGTIDGAYLVLDPAPDFPGHM